jgi:hypothetical protein
MRINSACKINNSQSFWKLQCDQPSTLPKCIAFNSCDTRYNIESQPLQSP